MTKTPFKLVCPKCKVAMTQLDDSDDWYCGECYQMYTTTHESQKKATI